MWAWVCDALTGTGGFWQLGDAVWFGGYVGLN